MLQMATTQAAITTGIREISEAMGGGIRSRSLVLIEGEAKTGKSILSQHLAHGTLGSKAYSVAYYTAEQSRQELLSSMSSLSMDVQQDIATDRLRLFRIGLKNPKGVREYLRFLVKHFSELPDRFKLIIVDSITHLMIETSPTVKIDFLQSCKELTEDGCSIILVMGTHLLDSKTLARAYEMSDYYLKLRTKDAMIGKGQVDERSVKILDVTKLCGAERHGQAGVNFEIKPRVGIQILPFVSVKI